MEVYIFNSRNWNVRALALDGAGGSLPVAYAPWQLLGDSTLLSGTLAPAVFKALQRDGFFLTGSTPRIVGGPCAPVGKRRKVPVSKAAVG
jgi:hypothetical protein